MSKAIQALLLICILLAALIAESQSIDPLKPPPSAGGGGGGSCTYCSQEECGCPSYPGCTTVFSCSCSAIWCSRQCSPQCY